MHNPIPFVGRKEELNELKNHFNDSLDSHSSLVLVRGETGVGKTRLLEEFVGSIEPKVWILTGKALQNDVRPFSPFLQIIERYLEKIEYQPQWLVKCIEPESFPCFANFLPKLKSNYPIEISMSGLQFEDKRVFFNAMERFLSALVMYRPLVLLIDDIVWMDTDAQELFKYIVMRMSDKAILFICSARLWQKDTHFQSMIDELAEHRNIRIFDLTNLTESDVETLVMKQFGTTISSQFVNWLFHITKGNPLFISEVLNILLNRNIILYQPEEKKWNIRDDYNDCPLSPTIESIVKMRLRGLDENEHAILQIGSVFSEEFSLDMLSQLHKEISREQLFRTLNRLKAQKLLEEDDNKWKIAHPLIKELLYKEIDGSKRRKIHRRVSSLLNKNPETYLEEIFYHLTVNLTPNEETPELCRILLEIGKAILKRYNEQLGWRCFTCAKKIADKFPEELKTENLKIEAELTRLRWTLDKNAPSIQEMEKLIERLKSSGLREESAMLYRILFYHSMNALETDSAERYLKNGLSLSLKSEENYWLLRAENSILKKIKGKVKEAEDEALRLIKEIDSNLAPRALWRGVYNLGTIAFSRGELRAAHEYMLKALKIAEQYNIIHWRTTSYANLGQIEMKLGQLDSALDRLREVVKDAELSQWARQMAGSWAVFGICLSAKGEFENAIKYFDDSITKSRKIEYKRALLLAQLGKIETLLEMDRVDEAKAELDSVSTRELGEDWLCDIHLLKSRIWLEKEDLERAEREIECSLNLAEKLNVQIKIAEIITQKAIILLRQSKESEAVELFEKAQQIVLQKEARSDLSSILTRFGLEMGGDKGDRIVAQGLEILFTIGAVPRVEHLLEKIEIQGFKQARAFAIQKLDEIAPKQERLEIMTFGGLSVKRPGEFEPITPTEWQSKKARELLSLILLHSERKGATREILASFLWPELDTQKSQNNLRVTLARLNQTLRYDYIKQESQSLLLDKTKVSVDFWQFEELFKEWNYLKQQAKSHRAERKAQEAIALYRGDFLPELYGMSIEEKQSELKEKMKQLLYWLAHRSCERLEWTEAISFARRLIALDSSNESAHRIIIKGLWQQGNRTGAIRQFERLRDSLKKEFSISPNQETLELYNKIIDARK
jgi:two-component SAPR family response regulator/Tfp pilus assembly protein PilF